MKKLFPDSLVRLLAVCLVAVGLAGCNTIAGIGKDVERAGEVVQDAAKKR